MQLLPLPPPLRFPGLDDQSSRISIPGAAHRLLRFILIGWRRLALPLLACIVLVYLGIPRMQTLHLLKEYSVLALDLCAPLLSQLYCFAWIDSNLDLFLH